MKIILDGVEHDFDSKKVRNDEAMGIERACKCTYDEWSAALTKGSAMALTGLVWLIRRRENPGLKFQDVSFALGDIEPVIEDTPADEEGASANDPANPTAAGEVSATDAPTT